MSFQLNTGDHEGNVIIGAGLGMASPAEQLLDELAAAIRKSSLGEQLLERIARAGREGRSLEDRLDRLEASQASLANQLNAVQARLTGEARPGCWQGV